jgi:DnaJ-class molecular chaperone
VPTLDGAVRLDIPKGTQNGQVFRLRGKGMPAMGEGNGYGDLYAKIAVRLPTDLNKEQKELFDQLRQMSNEKA